MAYMIVIMNSDSDCDNVWDWDRHRCRQCLSIKGMIGHTYGLLICDKCIDRRRARNKADIDELRVCVEGLRVEGRHKYHINKEKISQHNSDKVKCPLCESVVSRSSLSKHKKSKKCLGLRKYKDDDDDTAAATASTATGSSETVATEASEDDDYWE